MELRLVLRFSYIVQRLAVHKTSRNIPKSILKKMSILIILENLIRRPWTLQIDVARCHDMSNNRYCVLPRNISNTKDPV